MQFEQPDGALWPVCVLLFDPQADRLHVRRRVSLGGGAGCEDATVLKLLLDQLAAEAHTESGGSILRQLEDSLSNAIRITERTSIRVDDVDTALDELAGQHFR